MSARVVIDEVAPAFEKLREQGKMRFPGITAVGDTPALHKVIDSRAFVSAQVSYNMLNPSAAESLPANYPAQDYGKMFDHTQSAGVGVVGIRVLAGGALSGVADRHPIASPAPEPIGSATAYDADLARARRLSPLVQEGHASSLAGSGDTLRHRAQGDGLDSGRHGDLRGVRAVAGGSQQGTADADSAFAAYTVAARLRRRTPVTPGFGICCRRETSPATVNGRGNT